MSELIRFSDTSLWGAGGSAYTPGRHGRPQPGGTRVLRSADRCVAGRGNPAGGDALSLGSAGRARRSGRMAGPGRRLLVRRLCPPNVPGARRPRGAVGHTERAVGGHWRRVFAWRSGAGPPQPVLGPDRHP